MVTANVPEPWTVPEIMEFLNKWRATVKVQDGKPNLFFPSDPIDRWGNRPKRVDLIAEIVPHLTARKAEILAWLSRTDPDVRRAEERAARRELRKRLTEEREAIVTAVVTRGREAGKKVWYLANVGGRPEMGDAQKELPPYANLISVAGDGHWTALPKIAEPPAKADKRPKKRAFTRPSETTEDPYALYAG